MRQKIQLILIYALILITLLVQASCKASAAAVNNETISTAGFEISGESTESAFVTANESSAVDSEDLPNIIPAETTAQEEPTTANAASAATSESTTAGSLISSSETAAATNIKPVTSKPTTTKPITAKPTTAKPIATDTTITTKSTATTAETTEQPANPNEGYIPMDPTPVPVGTYSSDMAQQVLVLVNQARADAGYPALTWNDTLAAACDVRAKEIATNFSHARPDGTGAGSASNGLGLGENIAKGRDLDTALTVMNAWMASEGHKNNLLGVTNPYTITAVACYCVNGVYYWVQEFG